MAYLINEFTWSVFYPLFSYKLLFFLLKQPGQCNLELSPPRNGFVNEEAPFLDGSSLSFVCHTLWDAPFSTNSSSPSPTGAVIVYFLFEVILYFVLILFILFIYSLYEFPLKNPVATFLVF